MYKSEFDRILQKAEKAFSFFHLQDRDQFALVTAQRTKKKRFTAFDPQRVHAVVAHHLVAVRAPVGGLGV
jgi:hypothetical protein